MILAFDTHYDGLNATTVCICFPDWGAKEALSIYQETVAVTAPYISGQFYKRELPCILHLFSRIKCEHIEAVIIDGYVYLDDHGKPGLGGRLYESLGEKISVIGVAKTSFATIRENRVEVFRGKSKRPLYVTAAGINKTAAAILIKNMYGYNRIPDLLKRLDTLTRERGEHDNGKY